jgi:hypothetical protein
MIKFKEINESKYISNKQKSVDFNFYFIINIIDWESATGDAKSKYAAEVLMVSPELCSPENLKKASEGLELKTEIAKVDTLSEYGIYSPCFQLYGNDSDKLLTEAKEKISTLDIEANLSEVKNGMGATGRDFIRGNLLGHAFTTGTLTLKNGVAVVEHEKKINQGSLTSECWLIQMQGLEACKTCEFLNKRDCGGKRIRKQLTK